MCQAQTCSVCIVESNTLVTNNMDRTKGMRDLLWFDYSEGLTFTTSVTGVATHLEGLLTLYADELGSFLV